MRSRTLLLTSLLSATALAAGSFQPPELWSAAPLLFEETEFGDFDGDGRPDLSPYSVGPDSTTGSAYREILLNASGRFTPTRWFGSNVCNGQCLWGDFDGDGRTDFLRAWTPVMVSLAQPGAFSPARSWGASLPDPRQFSFPSVALTGRFSPGTRDDYAVLVSEANRTASADSLQIWPSTGTGFAFAPGVSVPREAQASQARSGEPWVVRAADVTGDGLFDLVLVSRESGNVYIEQNLGPVFGFAPARLAAVIPVQPKSVVLRRVDPDRLADLLTVSSTGQVTLFRSTGQQFLSMSVHPLGCVEPRRCAFGDVTGDGWLDVVSSTSFGGFEVSRWLETPPPPSLPSFFPSLPPITPLPWVYPPAIAIHSGLVQGAQACGPSAVARVTPSPSTTRLVVEAVEASGARRLIRDFRAPSGGRLSEPVVAADSGLTWSTVRYLVTATYADGNTNSATAPFTPITHGPSYSSYASLTSASVVTLTLNAILGGAAPIGASPIDSLDRVEVSLWSGRTSSCTRKGISVTCSFSRADWNNAASMGFSSAIVTTVGPPRCNGWGLQTKLRLTSVGTFTAFPVSGGAGGGSAGGGTASPMLPDLVLEVPAHDGFNANWRICNRGTAPVSSMTAPVMVSYRAEGWLSSMSYDATHLAAGLGIGSCLDGPLFGIGVSPGTGGGSLLAAPSVTFCVDTTGVVSEGAGELPNCFSAARR
ncbi:MAG: VCBS repeat-containing protein [Myxococcales bacterium]|nr:VCBS repeat-containing protein [Myxococcales bacterium]